MTGSLENAESNGDAGQQNYDRERKKMDLRPTQKTEEKRCCEGREHELPSCTGDEGALSRYVFVRPWQDSQPLP